MAGSVNKVVLVGRLGQDPKLTYLPSGKAVANFSVATDESYKDRDGNKVERTEWHNVAVFGRSAEFCGNYLGKGRLVYVEGTLRTRSWEKDGEKRYTTEVVVTGPGHCVQALDRGQDQGQQPAQQPRQAGGRGRQAQQEDLGDLGPSFPSEASGLDDIPFALLLVPLAALAMTALQSGWLA